MKKCDRLEKALINNGKNGRDAFARGGELETHVRECPDCSSYLAAFQKADELLAGLSNTDEQLGFCADTERAEILSKIKALKKAGSVPAVKKIQPAANAGGVSFFEKLAAALAGPKFAAGLLTIVFIGALLLHWASRRPDDRAAGLSAENGFLYSASASGGKVFFEYGGVEREMAPEENLRAGVTVKTTAGARCSLSSRYAAIELLPDSRALVEELRVRLFSGGASMKFDKNTLKNAQIFIVILGGVDVAITGTAINARVTEETVSVELVDGEIKLKSDSFPALAGVSLAPGERLEAGMSKKTFVVFGANGAVIRRHPSEGQAAPSPQKPRVAPPENGKSGYIPAPAAVNTVPSVTREIPAGASAGKNAVNSGEIEIENSPGGLNDGPSPFQSN